MSPQTREGEALGREEVKFPIRRLKGFSEVQVCQPQLELELEVAGSEARPVAAWEARFRLIDARCLS